MALNERTGPPKLTEPEFTPAPNLILSSSKAEWSAAGSEAVVEATFEFGAEVCITESIIVEPYLTPTIFILPVSIPRNAQIFVMNEVIPLLL